MEYIANHYKMVNHNVGRRFQGPPRQAPLLHRFRQPYPVRSAQKDPSYTPAMGYSYMKDHSWGSERLYPQYWNSVRQVMPANHWQFTEDVPLTWNSDPSAYFEGLEQIVPLCDSQFAADWSESWCDDLSGQLYSQGVVPQREFPQQQFLVPQPAPTQYPAAMQYPVPLLSPWPQGPTRRRHQKKMQRLEEPYRRPPVSTDVSQTITTQLKQMKASLQSLLVTWKPDKLELAAICVAVYDDNCLTKILWMDEPGTHIFMLFGNKGVRIEVYGLGKVGNNSDAFYVSVSGRKDLKVMHLKDYSQWETLVLRRRICDRNLLDAFVMKESFQMHPTRMVHTHYKMSIEDPEDQTQEHKHVGHSENDIPLNKKQITTSTAKPTHVSTLAQTLLQSACNAFEPPTSTTSYTGLKTGTNYTVQNPFLQKEESHALQDRTVDTTCKNALSIMDALVGTTPVDNQQNHDKSDTDSERTTQDPISKEKTSSNVSQAVDKPHTSLYPILCSDSLSELSGPSTSTDDSDTESINTCTSLHKTALDDTSMGSTGITPGEANRHSVATGESDRCSVASSESDRCSVATDIGANCVAKGESDRQDFATGDAIRCGIATGGPNQYADAAAADAVAHENVADISTFLVLDSTGDNLTGSDCEGKAFLGFDKFDETLQAPIKKSKVGNGEVRVFEAPSHDGAENLKTGKKRPFSEISNTTVAGNMSSEHTKNRPKSIARAKKKMHQKNMETESPLLPQRFAHENKEMLLLLRFYKSGKVYFVRGRVENGGLDIPFSLVASEKYEARMFELATETASLRTFIVKGVSNFLTFTTSLTVQHLERLQEMAEEFISSSQSKYHHLKHFYRNKPPPYFWDIFHNHNGVMKPYLKDHNGDQLSPINGKLNGLFFSASVKFSNGKVPSASCFGEKRLYVPAEVLFDGNTCLYFTDFYCTSSRGPHYVTLVMTRKGSDADLFCQTRLRQLNPFNNPFLYKRNCSYGWQVFTCTCSVCLHIEVFYTENVDIKWLLDRHRNNAYFEDVVTFGQGHSSLMGIPKNTKCKVCNFQLGLPLKRQPK